MLKRILSGAGLAALVALSACVETGAPETCAPRMSDIQAIGSHNSYKLAIPPDELEILAARSPKWGAALDYAHIPIFEQLELGMRQIELDVYYDPEGGRYTDPLLPRMVGAAVSTIAHDAPGFKVMHVQDVDARSSCILFVQCLAEIQAWSTLRPDHAPILILINAKQDKIDLPGSVDPLSFDAAAFDALDAEIRSIFSVNHVLTPDDVRGESETLRDAVLSDGWPALEDSWGKIFFALDERPEVVETYRRGASSLQGHAMFVNSSGPAAADAAYFTMNEPIEQGELIAERVAQGFIVRTRADADTVEARTGDRTRLDAALASGAQYISTDYYKPRREWSDYAAALPGGETLRTSPHSTCAIP
ncbi:MAG: phosphatidylinositol-specific phospholipase C1-like protein [Hyphomonadaceae bacterium]|nr:phosphatidylinositol-specific phospholipase C1-like protein [Hyphomonadaceae bacterium]